MGIEAYIDDSGSDPQSPIFFLAGFLSTVERWAAFSNEWDSALSLPPKLDYFKMSEAAWLGGQFSKRKGWDEAKRDDRLVTLARIINKYGMLRVSVSIRHDLFDKYLRNVPAVERNLATDEPYVMLFMHMISLTVLFADKHGIKEPIDFVFDEQSGFKDEVRRLWPAYKLSLEYSLRPDLMRLIGSEPSFLDEKTRLPLQAADLYAWQARKHYVDNHQFNNQKIIVPMNATYRLFRGIPYAHGAMKEDMLKRQHAALLQTGERIAKEQPSVRLIAANPDRKERRKIRRQTKSKNRNKI